MTNAEAVAGLLRGLFADATTALDMTYSSGRFWSWKHPVAVEVTGLDLDPDRARDVGGGFRALDVADGSFDVRDVAPPLGRLDRRDRTDGDAVDAQADLGLGHLGRLPQQSIDQVLVRRPVGWARVDGRAARACRSFDRHAVGEHEQVLDQGRQAIGDLLLGPADRALEHVAHALPPGALPRAAVAALGFLHRRHIDPSITLPY